MFLCSGAGAAQPPSEGVLRGTRKNKAIGAVFRYGTCASPSGLALASTRVWFPAVAEVQHEAAFWQIELEVLQGQLRLAEERRASGRKEPGGGDVL